MARVLKLDMTNVESFSKCSEGIHTVKAISFEEKNTQNGDDMIAATLEVTKGNDKGCRLFDNFVLTDKALWKLKQFLVAVGVKADGKVAIDLDKLIGKVCDVEVFHEEYNGVERARVGEYLRPQVAKAEEVSDYEDADEDDEPEEAPAPKPAPVKRKPKPAPEPEPEEDEDEAEDEDEEEEPAPAPKKKVKPAPKEEPAPAKKGKAKPAVKEESDDDDEEWEDWEDA